MTEGPDEERHLIAVHAMGDIGGERAARYLDALAVGHLAQRLSGEGRGLSWPDGVAPIPEADRKELQQLLAIQGYDVGAADGIIGPKTRAAVRKYQRNEQLPVDGFPRPELLERLKAKVPAKP